MPVLNAFDRNAFVKALWLAKLARRITPNAYLIGRAMLRRATRSGSLWPSKATLAAAVGVSERTVARALDSLSALALLAWRRRAGQLHRFSSNLYRLASPVASPAYELKLRKRKKGMIFESSAGNVSDGSPRLAGAELERRLTSLGRLLGVPSQAVLPWQTAA